MRPYAVKPGTTRRDDESRLRGSERGVKTLAVTLPTLPSDSLKLPTERRNTFESSPTNPRVEVAFGEEGYRVTREALARVSLERASGARVLVKPNAGRIAAAGTGTNTSPEVVAAVVDAFLEAGAKVSVGDSPIAGVGPREALEASGIADVRAQARRTLTRSRRASERDRYFTGRSRHRQAQGVCRRVRA